MSDDISSASQTPHPTPFHSLVFFFFWTFFYFALLFHLERLTNIICQTRSSTSDISARQFQSQRRKKERDTNKKRFEEQENVSSFLFSVAIGFAIKATGDPVNWIVTRQTVKQRINSRGNSSLMKLLIARADASRDVSLFFEANSF